jgi:hypothetical protein
MPTRPSELFAGTWLITEYVYDPDGTPVGTLRRRQRLEPQAEGHARVFVTYEPRLKIDPHPVAIIEGDWTFEMVTGGRLRRYYGPDLIGVGMTWGTDAIMSQGLWPRVGYNFTSLHILTAADRQLTSTKIYQLGQLVAVCVGVGTPEALITGEHPYPAFTNPMLPAEVAAHWYGTAAVFDPGYRVQAEWNVVRHYGPQGWRDEVVSGARTTLTLDDMGRYQRISGSGDGLARRYGWALETTYFNTPSPASERGAFGEVWRYDGVEIVDPARKLLVNVTHSYADGVLAQISITRFRPNVIQ